ncbi:MAG: hypothetical protein AAFQ14_08620 [Cyanobacteria bacterium J06621_12]
MLIDIWLTQGGDTTSVEPDAVPKTYKAIARAEKKLFLNQVRDILTKIKAKAAREYPNDFSTQKYLIDQEIKAWQALYC